MTAECNTVTGFPNRRVPNPELPVKHILRETGNLTTSDRPFPKNVPVSTRKKAIVATQHSPGVSTICVEIISFYLFDKVIVR